MSNHATWPPSNNNGRKVNDVVHSSIALYHPLDVIVDTPQFQRLRRVRQLGIVSMVYPSADHSRFTHCLGTCHVAQLVVEALRVDEKLSITSEDALCVSIAALCHDLGHGPYSHLFDGPFMEAVGKGGMFTHESASKKILGCIVALPHVECALRVYLGGEEEQERYQRNMKFIEECISPPQMLAGDGVTWLLEGRPKEKSFLYDIVSNVHDSLDVDKYDYILRDAKLSGVGTRFNYNSLRRIIQNIKVLTCPTLNIRRICYAKKTSDELLNLADSRRTLHDRLYQHSTVKVIESMVVQALVAADGHLSWEGDDGQMYTLSTIIDNMEVYCRVDDTVLQLIEYSRNPELAKARSYLLDITARNLAKKVHLEETSPRKLRKRNNNHSSRSIDLHQIADDLKSRMIENAKGIDSDDVVVVSRCLHGGLDGERHPMTQVLVYDNKTSNPMAQRLDKNWLELRTSSNNSIISFALHVGRHVQECDKELLRTEFMEALEEYGIRGRDPPSPI